MIQANPLTSADVYNFYGLTMLSAPEYKAFKSRRMELLLDIKQKYVEALKSRIKAEAGYIDLDVEGDSIEAILKQVSNHLNSALEAEAESMRKYDSKGFNIMKFVKQFHTDKPKGLETAPDAFRSKQGTSVSMFGGEPWAKIAEAFLAIAQAKTDSEIILSIDALNSLQHNTNYVLVDIAGVPGVDQLQEMMNEKFVSGPKELAPKMSVLVRELLEDAGVL